MQHHFLIDEKLEYPGELELRYSATVANFRLMDYFYEDPKDLVAIKSKLQDLYNKYNFDINYSDIPATVYAENLINNTSVPWEFDAFTEEMLSVANPVMEKAYKEGRLDRPLFLLFGESLRPNLGYMDRVEIILLSIPPYTVMDYTGKLDKYPRVEEYSMLKWGEYEKLLHLNIRNNYDNNRTYNNYVSGQERIRDDIINWVYKDDIVRVIGLSHSSFDIESDFCKELLTTEFWEKFILAQILNSSPYDTFMESIINTEYAMSKFINNLLESDKREITSISAKMVSTRENIETLIRDITSYKLSLKDLEYKLIEKKKAILDDNRGTKLVGQIRNLLNNPNVERIEYTDTLDIITHPILIDGVVPLGGYTIKLSVGKNPQIFILNNENPINGFDHPHVNCGSPCWGNYTDVYVHLAEMDLISTAEIIFRYLESWNPDDEWGKHLIWWDPKYAFNTLTEMDLLDTVDSEEYSHFYYDAFGESMPNECCSHCGEHLDECSCSCPRCGEYKDESCECNRCRECGELHEPDSDDCYCERCDYCDELLDDCQCDICYYCRENRSQGNCSCEICLICGENITAGDCICERCKECGEILEECTCEKEEEELEEAV